MFLIQIYIRNFLCAGEEELSFLAVAGPDQLITLPTDSVSLDGLASSDPDGTISVLHWKQISGPASLIIINATAEKTGVNNLSPGSQFQFQPQPKYLLHLCPSFYIMIINDIKKNVHGKDI